MQVCRDHLENLHTVTLNANKTGLCTGASARCWRLAAFAAVTTAFTGIPGYVKPRFSVLSSTTNGDSASSKAGVNTDSNRWQDLAALDPEVGMWSHHQKRQRMKQEAARRHHEMRQQATGDGSPWRGSAGETVTAHFEAKPLSASLSAMVKMVCPVQSQQCRVLQGSSAKSS